jgi:hypothetical protein
MVKQAEKKARVLSRTEVGSLFRVGAPRVEMVLPLDGKEFSLQELQKFVGGFIERVPGALPLGLI